MPGMIFRPMPSRRSSIPLVVAVVLLCSDMAFAATGDPLNILVGTTQTRDDNVFRAPAAFAPVADTISSSYLGIVFDTDLSMQHLHAEAFGNDTRYEKLQDRYLNNTGSRYQAGWQGWLWHELKIDANWNRSEALAGFADFRSTIKNIVTNANGTLRLQYLLTPDWSLVGLVASGSSTNGAAANAASDSKTRSGELGVQYDSPLGNRLGLVVRNSIGHYPNRQLVPGFSFVDNSYRQQDIEGSMTWVATGLSHFDLHLAQTRRDQDDIPQRNFKGVTGSASWDWALTPIAAINTYVGRDLGATDDLRANYAVTRSIGIAPRWTPTPKLTVQARIEKRDRTFGGDPRFSLAGTSVPGDTTRSTNLSVQYAATQAIQLSLSATHETRNSSDPTLPYSSNVLSLSGQLMF